MAYFQMTWTQTNGGNPFESGENKLTQTQTTGPFTSPLNLKQNIIPYPPPAIDFEIPQVSINTAPCIVTFTWTASPIPTPYEVNPLLYTYRVYDNDTGELMITDQTTSLSGTFTIPDIVIPLTTAQTYTTTDIDYIGHYFYSQITATGGGGTSDPATSALSWFYPDIMLAGTVVDLSITILSGVITIVAGMTFLSNPFAGGNTQVNLALQSSTTSGGSYSLTDNFDTLTQYGSNVPGQYTFDYVINYGVQAGKYYKIFSVQTAVDGSRLPSYLSTWNATPFFYNPTMSPPTLITKKDGEPLYFVVRGNENIANKIQFTLTPNATSPVLYTATNFTWTLYTSATENGTYTVTGSTDTFADSGEATTTYNDSGTGTFATPAPYNTWCKLYVIAVSANIVSSSSLISEAFLSPNKVNTPIIASFTLAANDRFNSSWSIAAQPAAASWEYQIWESTTENGTFTVLYNFTLDFTLRIVSAFDTYLPGGATFTAGYWYKLYVIAVGSALTNVYSSDAGISNALEGY
jgi:hypothetical protein